MRIIQNTILALLAGISSVMAANTIKFVSKDNLSRTLYWTSNPGFPQIPPIRVPGGAHVVAPIPWGWEGNAYSVIDGRPNKFGMLIEVAFNKERGTTYFDVSAIVDPRDFDNIHMMYPVSGRPTGGCEVFPCPNVYWHNGDPQTKSSQETDFIVTLHRS